MNIGIFTDCYYPQINGVISSILILREELIKRGHKVTIITVKVPGYKDSSEDVIRINSIPFSKWREFRLAMPFFVQNYKQIKALNLDLIHTHTEFSIGLLGKYIARILNIPLIHTYHTMYEDYTHYLLPITKGRRLVKKLIIYGSKNYVKKYNAIIAPSYKTKSALERYGVKNDIYIVPTGIDLKKFQHVETNHPKIQEIRNELSLCPDDLVILSLGRISEEKSIDIIIKQMVDVKKFFQNAKLVIVGDGPYKNKLVQLTESLNLTDNVIFTGRIPWKDVTYYYNMADVFVSASKTETQGLTILEAMASGTPVVVYNDDNVKGVISDKVSGRLFTTKEELTECLKQILSDPKKRALYINNANYSIQALSTEHFGENAEKLYYNLISSKIHLTNVV